MTSIGGKEGYIRPACGVINVNYDIFKDLKTFDSLKIKEARRTLFHEITHAFVFSPNLMGYFIDEKGELLKAADLVSTVNLPQLKNQPFFSHANIKKLVGDYFKCPENPGMPLAAKDKAHFVQQIIADTMMKPMADSFEDRISVFIKELYKISGWYLINENAKVEQTLWGKGKGCKFVQLECNDDKGNLFEEYCDQSNKKLKQGCDFYHTSPSICALYTGLQDNTCPIMNPTDTVCTMPDTVDKTQKNAFPDQFYGENSKCIEFNDSQGTRFSGCFEATCDDSNRSIKVKIGSKEEIAQYDKEGKPSKPDFTAPVSNLGEIKFLFPPNYDRFCFYKNNPQQDKGFKKKKRGGKRRKSFFF